MSGKIASIPERRCLGSALGPKGLGDIMVFEPNDDPKATKGGIRVVLFDHKLVVKLFDTTTGETYSVKLWAGTTLDKVAAQWRMNPREGGLTDQEFKLLCEALFHWTTKARELLLELAPGFGQMSRFT